MANKDSASIFTLLIKTIFMAICVGFVIVGFLLMTLGSILAFVPGDSLADVVESVKSSHQLTRNYTLPNTVEEIQAMPMVYEIGITLFTFGTLLSALSLFGSCGVCCPCCPSHLVIFALLMLSLMIAETCIVSMFIEKDSPLHDGLRSSLRDKIKTHYNEKGSDPFSKIMNLIMFKFQCCGIDGVSDFSSRPVVCEGRNTMGCYRKLRQMVEDHYKIAYLREIAASIILLQLSQITAASLLF